ncbi:hypothetical protein I4641_10450 [Waterburya agarophytonicola K14]|uniref:Uncharacterized protein n=1 Tax=Waterburya agarophytonicola KI4 TaxID=2874699 RepID=A0A964BR94_9CYAN|nr:hypothetical protein [Waterburya agarophytonicola]MCC0177396.1 hypothetical protein [Waterburya agarophytonicola KI4]
MKQNIQVFQRSSSLWEKFLDLNPQLFREIQGRLKTRNVVISAAISVITQFMITICCLGELPQSDPKQLLGIQYGRYAMGSGYNPAYTKDMLGEWVINWQLLWLDLFMALSMVSIFTLLIVGTYMLIADTVKEESRGTLNFIRLTPQSADSIFLGKILGVPILLYVAILLLLPLHTISGLGAHIPLTLIMGFDGVIVASCAFCYSLALLWSLMNLGLSGFKPWLASGLVGSVLLLLTVTVFNNSNLISNGTWDWLFLFNPTLVLAYLIDATYLSLDKIDFLSVENLKELLFYGQALWTKASFGIGFILFNFSVWTYWCWSVLRRRFHNPDRTLFSKTQSYWITAWFVVIGLGFTLQNNKSYSATDNFIFLQMCLCMLGLALIAALSPHRQTLYDWARYRHQTHENGNILWKELVFGENSPSVIAVAINMAIAVIYIAPSIFLILEPKDRYILWGFVLSGFSILLYALVAQLVLTLKTRKRAIWSAISVINLIIIPPLCLGFADVIPKKEPLLWLFSFLPTVATEYATLSTVMLAILGQVVAASLIGLQMTRKLKQAGRSETKMLFDRNQAISS